MEKKIHTIEALEAEQRRQKQLMEATKKEFMRSFGSSRRSLQNFLLTKVALPAGAVGLGVAAVKKISSNGSEKNETTVKNGSGQTENNWVPLVLMGLELANSYLSSKN